MTFVSCRNEMKEILFYMVIDSSSMALKNDLMTQDTDLYTSRSMATTLISQIS